MLFSNHPASENLLSENIENQTDIQHNDPVEDNVKGKEKSKERKRTKVMEEWLTCRDIYLKEMLRHDG